MHSHCSIGERVRGCIPLPQSAGCGCSCSCRPRCATLGPPPILYVVSLARITLQAWLDLPHNVRSGDSNISKDDALRVGGQVVGRALGYECTGIHAP